MLTCWHPPPLPSVLSHPGAAESFQYLQTMASLAGAAAAGEGEGDDDDLAVDFDAAEGDKAEE